MQREEYAGSYDPFLVADLFRLLGSFVGCMRDSPGLKASVQARARLKFEVLFPRDGAYQERRLLVTCVEQLPESMGDKDYSRCRIPPKSVSHGFQTGTG